MATKQALKGDRTGGDPTNWLLDEEDGISMNDLLAGLADEKPNPLGEEEQTVTVEKMSKALLRWRDSIKNITEFMLTTEQESTVATFSETGKGALKLLQGEKSVMKLQNVHHLLHDAKGNNCGKFGLLSLTDYRIHFTSADNTQNFSIPLGTISRIVDAGVVSKKVGRFFCLEIQCKDVHNARFSYRPPGRGKFGAGKQNFDRFHQMLEALAFRPVKHMFALTQKKNIQTTTRKEPSWQTKARTRARGRGGRGRGAEKAGGSRGDSCFEGWQYRPLPEWRRLKVAPYANDQPNNSDSVMSDLSSKFRITRLNENFKISPTYPPLMLIPKDITDKQIEKIANYRSKGRMPAFVWRCPSNHATLWRCAQPMSGLRGKSCAEDQLFFQKIIQMNESGPRKLYFIDARPKKNAMANKMKGAGFEDMKKYINCELHFQNIENIHVMRSCQSKLSKLCLSERLNKAAIRKQAHSTNWYVHLSLMIESSFKILERMNPAKSPNRGASVVVHCSDGWDRTPQLCCLVELLGDPHVRTISGFRQMMDREWVSFGHKFAYRIGQGSGDYKDKERSPIFLQFIESVWQLMRQIPDAFEFNSKLLMFLMYHLYSGRYGNFLSNTVKQRKEEKVYVTAPNVWGFVLSRKRDFLCPTYKRSKFPGRILRSAVKAKPSELILWGEYWLRWRKLFKIDI
eukprot:TRINITY_DN8064_c0_g1_i1.p1 TRINITY_DN8064_c0_g1~~TRINITY_DN8064_c0_g1_i1.p1  ORF type:complete len:768 (+),score=133.04 TRINITY_DN8064_c0_g1_i1:257-2305(+)